MRHKHKSLQSVVTLFDILSLNVSPTARCKHIQMFLLVVANEGASISELHQQSNKGSLSGTFKLVRELSVRSWRKQAKKSSTQNRIPGLGLVRLEPDEFDERIQRVYLTKKGKQLIQKLLMSV